MAAGKRQRDLVRVLQRRLGPGFSVNPTRGGHLAVFRHGRRVAVTSQTPSDWRATRNLISDIRRTHALEDRS